MVNEAAPPVSGRKIDPDEITIGIAAAKRVANGITYMGVGIGPHITEAQYWEFVSAIVTDIEEYRSGGGATI